MKIKIILEGNGKIYDLTNICVGEILLTSTIENAPSNLKLRVDRNGLLKAGIKIEEGDVIKLYADDIGKFKGYVFYNFRNGNKENEILAYDQLRYLNNKDSYYLKNLKASEIIKNISTQFKINIGIIEDTKYVIPILVGDNKSIWNIFESALKLTEEATNEKYIIYDDFGEMVLKNTKELLVPFFFSSDDKLMIDYNLKTNIDSDTYNRVKMFKYDKERKVHYPVVIQEGDSFNKWGVLQYSEYIDDEINYGQAKELARKILEAKNKKSYDLSIVDFGNINITAGVSIGVKISDSTYSIDDVFSVKECVHIFKNNEHIMKLQLIEQ